jgi:hypothetical protein
MRFHIYQSAACALLSLFLLQGCSSIKYSEATTVKSPPGYRLGMTVREINSEAGYIDLDYKISEVYYSATLKPWSRCSFLGCASDAANSGTEASYVHKKEREISLSDIPQDRVYLNIYQYRQCVKSQVAFKQQVIDKNKVRLLVPGAMLNDFESPLILEFGITDNDTYTFNHRGEKIKAGLNGREETCIVCIKTDCRTRNDP